MKLPGMLSGWFVPRTEPAPHEFAPRMLRIERAAPNPLGRTVLRVLATMLGLLALWATVGHLDIVAVAPGKLVPSSYVKIVQPAEAGVIKDILVREGQPVVTGQVLMRMDALIADADGKSLEAEYQRKRLGLQRIDAELAGTELVLAGDASPALAGEILAQYRANRAALAAALAEERTRLVKARQDMAAAEQVKAKLEASLPYYREQDKAYEKLAKNGFVGPLMNSDKRRERLEKEQELKTQEFVIESARAGISQTERKLVQIESDYRRQLHAERNEASGAHEKLAQEIAKQSHRQALLELKASQTGVVKDLATHTVGTVVQPGTILMTLVPRDEALRAEVWVGNEDVGFIRAGQPVKLKLATFPFQRYGMINAVVEHIGADAADGGTTNAGSPPDHVARGQPLLYRALLAIDPASRDPEGNHLPIAAGMQVSAEIHLGRRTVLEYLLSPIQKAWHEAARER
ncbi:MAG: HlyD family type I secretion periplasmic adaptor subunit [Sulfuritalea sp.]|nr:HlyD family type I secretion periplasmic adaptor subunit [Sulfuritalea sp.]